QKALAAALETLEQTREQAKARSGPPAPGDLYVFRLQSAVAVEWVFVLAHPEQPGQVFVVPLDDAPLAGTPDVRLPAELVNRPLTARCGQGTWVPVGWLDPRLRVGAVGAEAHHLVRQSVADLAQ